MRACDPISHSCVASYTHLLQDLVSELKSEVGGDFGAVMLGLMMTPAEFDAYSMKQAVKGLGTDEEALIEVLSSRTNAELEATKDVYKKSKKDDLSTGTKPAYLNQAGKEM